MNIIATTPLPRKGYFFHNAGGKFSLCKVFAQIIGYISQILISFPFKTSFFAVAERFRPYPCSTSCSLAAFSKQTTIFHYLPHGRQKSFLKAKSCKQTVLLCRGIAYPAVRLNIFRQTPRGSCSAWTFLLTNGAFHTSPQPQMTPPSSFVYWTKIDEVITAICGISPLQTFKYE